MIEKSVIGACFVLNEKTQPVVVFTLALKKLFIAFCFIKCYNEDEKQQGGGHYELHKS